MKGEEAIHKLLLRGRFGLVASICLGFDPKSWWMDPGGDLSRYLLVVDLSKVPLMLNGHLMETALLIISLKRRVVEHLIVY